MSAAAGAASLFLTKSTLLDLSLWQISGLDTTNVTLTQPGGVGTPIILAHNDSSAFAAETGATLIGSNYTNVLVRAELLFQNWNTVVTDEAVGGPAVRINGTNGVSDWDAYFAAVRKFSSTSRRVRPRKYVAGTVSNVGVETSSLPSTWTNSTTPVEMETEINGTTLTTRARLLGEVSWAHEDVVVDTDISASGMVGIFCQRIQDNGSPMTININSFEVTPL